MVSPPPGVSSASRLPPMPSTNPFDKARPRPRPVELSVSPSRWNGTNTSSRRPAGMPGPWSMMRNCRVSAKRLADTRAGVPAGENRMALLSRFTTARCSRPGSASTGARSPGRSSCTVSGPRPSSSRAGSTTSARSTGPSATASAPACSRLTSSRLVTREARVSRLSPAVSSSSVRSLSGRVMSVARSPLMAVVAAAKGRRRSWPTAASRALRIRSASASGPTSLAV
nr:hypothetical protein BJQ95_00368 [Cryobacterium sp. SO1]